MTDGLQGTVSAEIRAEAARQRKTQADLALVLGISAQQVGKRLNGMIAFDVAELDKLARYFDVPVTNFLADAA